MRHKNKKNSGISLIAVAITVIVIIILSAIAINSLNGDNGIIKSTIDTKQGQKVASDIENLQKVVAECVAMGSNEHITLPDVIDYLCEQNVVDENAFEIDDDYTALVQLKDNYIYELKDDGNSEFDITFVGIGDDLLPTVRLAITEQTSSSITVTPSTRRADNGTIKFYLKEDGEYVLKGETDNTAFTFNNLTQNETYNIKAEVTDSKGQTAKTEITAETIDVLKPIVTFNYEPDSWTNGNVLVTAVASDEIEGMTLYIGDSINNCNTLADVGISVSSAQTVYAMYKDNSGQIGGVATGAVSKIDKTKPIIENVDAIAGNVTITAIDKDSGVQKYALTTANSEPDELSFQNDNEFTGIESGTTYYAWAMDKAGNISDSRSVTTNFVTYTITYYANSGTGSMSPGIKSHGSSFTIHNNEFTAPTDKVFKEWNTSQDGNGTSFEEGAIYSANADLNLYAIWKERNYIITYNANTGSGTMENGIKSPEESYTIANNGFTAPSEKTFREWNTSQDGNGTTYEEGAIYSINADLNLFAIWDDVIRDTTVTVTSDTAGCTVIPASSTQSEGTTVGLVATAGTGYDFEGWYVGNSDEAISTNANYTYTIPSGNNYQENITITGKFVAKSTTVTVTSDTAGCSVSPASTTQSAGTTVDLVATAGTGYNFLGWYVGDAVSPISTEASYTYTIPSGENYVASVAITGKFEIIQYTITYDANTGSGLMPPETKTHGIDYTVANNGFTAPNNFKIFSHWNTQADGNGTTYEEGATYSTEENVTLYAIWITEPPFRTYREAVTTNYNYGDKVLLNGGNPITVGNGTINDDWKVFYEDSNYLYLIFGDYYPVDVQTNPVEPAITFGGNKAYAITGSRANLLKYLRNNSAYEWNSSSPYGDDHGTGGSTYTSWDNLQTALSGTTVLNGKTISIQGSPDMDLWVKSWNAKGNTALQTAKNSTGYQIGLASGSTEYYVDLSSYTKVAGKDYNDTLYFPYKGNTSSDGLHAADANGYWLASPRDGDSSGVCYVYYSGYVGGSVYSRDYYCARPVIALSKENGAVTVPVARPTTLTIVSDSEGGTVTPTGTITKSETESIELTATPSTGYNFLGWYVGDAVSPISTEANYTYTIPSGANYSENITITGKFNSGGYTSSDIASNPSLYFGATINYPLEIDTTLNDKWKIFYADSDNIFIIPDSYVNERYLPLESLGLIKGSDGGATYYKNPTYYNYAAFWKAIPDAQEVTTSLKSSFKWDNWTNYSNGNTNVKIVSTMLNTSNWSNFVNSICADYAIGGPTIEMFCASWNAKYSGNKIYATNTGNNGYYIGSSSTATTTGYKVSSLSGYSDLLYFPDKGYSYTTAYWCASPGNYFDSTNNRYFLVSIGYDGNVTASYIYGDNEDKSNFAYGFRPVVRLKTGTKILESNDDDYDFEIKGLTPQILEQTYTITYNSNNGTGITITDTKQFVRLYNIATNEFEAQNGKIFKEWNTNEDGSGTTYLEGATYNVNADLTLYAIWEDKSPFKNYGTAITSNNVYGPIGTKVLLNNDNAINVGSNTIKDSWNVFYEDDDYIYLIYGDYYPVNVQTNSDFSTIVLNPNNNYPYGIKDNTSRVNLLKYLRNYSNYTWTEKKDRFVSGGSTYTSWNNLQTSLNGLSSLKGKSITVQGSPDIELWIKSWNAKGNTQLKITKTSNGYNVMGANETSNENYFINLKNNSKYNGTSNQANSTGYYDKLYFPYTSYTKGNTTNGNANGYWIASPGARGNTSMCFVGYEGDFGSNKWNYTTATSRSARPVIAIEKHWKEITYNANAGTGTMNTEYKAKGVDYTIAANGFTAPTGKVFKEWNTSADGTGTRYSAGATYSTDESLTLYAIWKDPVIAFRNYGEPVATNTVEGTYGTLGTQVQLNNGNAITVGSGTIQDNWKVFYEDDDFVYLIYGDYYPVNVQTNSDISTISFGGDRTYAVKDSSNRENLLKYLRNNSAYEWNSSSPYGDNHGTGGSTYASWDNLQAALSGTALRGKTISIQGSPDIELWVKSWNAKGNTPLKAPIDKYGYNIMGINETINDNQYINVNTSPYNTTANETNKTGYYDELYFPYRADNSNGYGYWLASPSSGGSTYVRDVCYNGYVSGDWYSDTYCCARPVVSIEKNILIRYDANGGTGTMSAGYKTEGEDYTAANGFTAPSGMKFKNWNTEADGSGTSYSAGATYSTDESLTLYAQWEEIIEYGTPAMVGDITVNGVTLEEGWRFLYDDAENIYLIYDGYLESSQIPAGANITKDGYNVYGTAGGRDSLTNYLNDTTIWSGFATGVSNALSSKGFTVSTSAIGSPTVEMFTSSYKASYPGDNFDAKSVVQGADFKENGSSSATAAGYVFKHGSSWNYIAELDPSDKPVYYPEIEQVKETTSQTADTYGYWLTGASAYNANNVCTAVYNGDTNNSAYTLNGNAVRPVVAVSKVDGLYNALKVEASAIYNANGGSFTNGKNQNTIYYGLTGGIETVTNTVTRYSHTSNINDSGTASGTYSTYLATKDVVTIPGATSLHVEIQYSTEASYDYVYVFQGTYTGTPSKNMSQGQLKTYNGGASTTANRSDSFDVTGDTVTFAVYSDGSVAYYGYYAVVTAEVEEEIDTIELTSLAGSYSEPTQADYLFKEWNTSADGTGTSFKTAELVEQYLKEQGEGANLMLYAQWKNKQHIVTFYANRTNAIQSTPVVYKQLIVDDGASVFLAEGYAEPTGSEEFACWRTITASESTDVDATSQLRGVVEDISVYAVYGIIAPEFGAVDTNLKQYFGETVNTKNGTTAEVNPTGGSDEWQLFYAEASATGNIYLIYKDYYPNAALQNVTSPISKDGTYSVNSTQDRKTLINYLIKKSNWTNVSSAFNTKFGVSGAIAIGAPTVDMFVASWNNNTNKAMTSATKPNDWSGYVQLFAPEMTNAQTDGLKDKYIGTTNDATTPSINTNSLTNTAYPGYTGSPNMYFPHPSQSSYYNNCYGYWLASPSASDSGRAGRVMFVGYSSSVDGNPFYYNANFCARPVVSLPKPEVQLEVSETDGTTLLLKKVQN